MLHFGKIPKNVVQNFEFSKIQQILANFANLPEISWILAKFWPKFFGVFPKCSTFKCGLLAMLRHAVSSKVQGTVKVRKFKKVRNLNSTRILICNPGSGWPCLVLYRSTRWSGRQGILGVSSAPRPRLLRIWGKSLPSSVACLSSDGSAKHFSEFEPVSCLFHFHFWLRLHRSS